MSAFPSPLKSPVCTSTQFTLVDQVAQRLVLNPEPDEMAVHHWPVCSARPVMSDLLSPLKSPTCTSTHVTPVDQVAHQVVAKAVEPLEMPTYQAPACK